MGENEWDKLSEKERQRRLMELKLKERQLRRDGKFDELGQLLNLGAILSPFVASSPHVM